MIETEPIISPSFFYWLQVADQVRVVFGIIFVFLLLALAVSSFMYAYVWLVCDEKEFPKKDKKKVSKLLFVIATFTFVCFIISTFTPSKNTLIEMEVAKHITTHNLKIAKKEFISFIKEIIKAVNTEKGGK
jgi:hypothetical protein